MKLAVLGTRGIPARYGGFETFAEELSKRMVARGHQVTVYCRQRPLNPDYEGADLRYVPTIRHKYLDTVVHTFLSTLHLIAHPKEVALYCNAANAFLTLLPRLAGIPVALNVDGLERKRKKWNCLGKAWYLLSERFSTFCPTKVITDAERIKQYYRQRYGKETEFIPYGAVTGKVSSTGVLRQLNLEPGRYFLYVSRMEPENNALLVRKAFEQVETDMKLALIGDAPYAQDYLRHVRDTRDQRVLIPGAIYGQGYHELISHCFAYIHATEIGGTHPALIEAMGRGAPTLYLLTGENEEVAGDTGIPFTNDLPDKLRLVLSMKRQEREDLGARAMKRIADRYDWDQVTTAYEHLLQNLLPEKN